MSDGFDDPIEVEADDSYLKAAELMNQVCLIHPTGVGSQPGTKPDSDGVTRPWEYVVCDVATLDRSGIVAFSGGVRISWRRCRLALEGQIGRVIGGKFVQAEGSKAIVLQPLAGTAREVAATCAVEFRHKLAGQTEMPATVDADGFDADTEPF